MNILVTNDDGILAPGLALLADVCREVGTVTVVAPDREQSGTSHSLTLHRPLRPTRRPDGAWQVDGTPTDCVMLAIQVLMPERPDFVFSGVNHGPNMGEDVLYSGTVSAAMEAVTLGVPGIGALLHIMLRRDLKANGVDPNSVKYVELGFPQAGDALKSGQIDAYPSQAPFTARILQSGAGKAVANWLSATPDGTPTVIFAAKRSWATAHKKEITAMQDAMREALTFMKDHRDETNQAIGKFTGLPAQVVGSLPPPIINVDLTPKQIQFWIDISKEQDLIKGNPKAEDIWFQ